MSVARALFLNRISGQMAVLILASLLAIHAIDHRRRSSSAIASRARARWTRRPGDLVALVRLVAAAPQDRRARLWRRSRRPFRTST